MASPTVKAILAAIAEEKANVYGICDFKDGVSEELEIHHHPEITNIYSLSKNIISLAIGILIDRHLLSLDRKVGSIFYEEYGNLSQSYSGVSVFDLLTQTTGISQGFLDVDREDPSSFPTKDYLRIVFKKGLTFPPGKKFVYSDSNYYVLSRIVSKIAHVSSSDFISREIFSPLGITDYNFINDPMGNSMGGTGIMLTPYEENLIGRLFLSEGKFNSKRIVSEDYVHIATSKLVKTEKDTFYGLSIWSKPSTDFFYGNGMDGQMMLVDKKNNEVVTYLSSEPSIKAWKIEQAMLHFLLK